MGWPELDVPEDPMGAVARRFPGPGGGAGASRSEGGSATRWAVCARSDLFGSPELVTASRDLFY